MSRFYLSLTFLAAIVFAGPLHAQTPTPVITSLSPNLARAGGHRLTLTINGSGFTTNTIVQSDTLSSAFQLSGGLDYVSPTQLTVNIFLDTASVVTTVNIYVENFVSGPTIPQSNSLPFTVTPQPRINSWIPAGLPIGGSALTLVLNGVNFTPDVSGNPTCGLGPFTYVSSTQITMPVSAALLASGTTNTGISICLFEDGGAESNSVVIPFVVAAATLTGLNPNTGVAGGPAFTLTINGTNFSSGATVQWNGSARPTIFVSSSQLQAAISATDIASPGTVQVTVSAPSAATSNTLPFVINPATACTYSASPSTFQFPATGGSLTIVFQGSSSCVWVISGLPSWITVTGPATGTGPATSTLTIIANNASDRSANISISGVSVAISQSGTTNVGNPVPTLGGLSLTSVTAGGPDFTITVTGNNFVSGSFVSWNASPRTTTFVSNTQLQATISASDIASAGTGQITVTNPTPGGGTSNALTLNIQALPLSTVGSFSQVASGGGWKTTFTIVNRSGQTVNGQLNLYTDAGTPLALPFVLSNGVQSSGSTVDFSVLALGSVTIDTEAATASINVGWAQLQATGPLSAYAIFHESGAGLQDSEGTAVLEISGSTSVVFAYDNTAGFQTGVALVNLGATDVAITAVLRDDTGAQIGTAQFTLVGLGHSSFFVNALYPATANRQGTIEFQDASGTLTGLGLSFSPALSFTSVPKLP